MDVRPWARLRAASQDLSKAPGFVIGPLTIEPSIRTMRSGSQTVTLEPRVMRVLVALAEAQRKVLSRDDLIALCWDGQIVGDNAINRVISMLRHALAELAGDSVRVETITKVGFRLVGDAVAIPPEVISLPLAAEQSAPGRQLARRNLLIGGGALGLAALGGWAALGGFTRYRPDPAAVALTARASTVMKSARIGSTTEAIRLYTRAVAIDPGYADAWGLLASSYRHALDGYAKGERRSYPQMVRSAAGRALAIDPGQPDALIALASIEPEFRNWNKLEPPLRALAIRFPDHWYANARAGIVLQEAGRFTDALQFTARVPEIDPQLSPAWAGLIRTNTMAGRFHEADAAFESAMDHVSPHPAIWFTRLSSLFESRRFAEAADFARDRRTLPEEFGPKTPEIQFAIAEALATGDAAGIARARDGTLATLGMPDMVPNSAPMLATLGEGEAALDAWTAYLLGGPFRGATWPRPEPFEMRYTNALFAPSLAPFRGDPRFGRLLEQAGFEDYWHESGSQPDFRRS